jgi:metal-dependent amidase/aminoacylase/carboxypeptidase family protein
MKQFIPILLLLIFAPKLIAAPNVQQMFNDIEPQVIKWRHHLHQNPELSNREFETAKYVTKHLKSLGLEVQTGVAITGVVAILDSGKPGPVVALRADMDGLPVLEKNNLLWKSTKRG